MTYKLKTLLVCVALAVLAICATIDLPVTLALVTGAGLGITFFGNGQSFIAMAKDSFKSHDDEIVEGETKEVER